MAFDPPQAALCAPPASASPAQRDKVRIRFRKAGDLRLVSHHDLMQCFERMLRRAALPFHSTEGYNPKPRMVFALSLALGIVGHEEVVELELDEPLPPEEIHRRLAEQALAGLEILQVRRIDRRLRARPRRACYRLAIPPERRAGLPPRIAALLAAPQCWVERTRPQPRRLDIRPYLRHVRLDGDALEMDFWVTPTGAARPDEVVAILGLADLLADGAVLERTRLELCDETDAADGPVPLGNGTAPLAGTQAAGPAGPTPLVPGPLSFDS